MNRTLVIVVNSVDFFLSHRLPIAVSALESGWRVVVATGSEGGHEKIAKYGLSHRKIFLSREGVSIWSEFKTFLSIFSLLYSERGAVFHFVTIKPVLYGGIASHFCSSMGLVFAISGLGSVFSSNAITSRLIRPIIRLMYKVALCHKHKVVIFQNSLDQKVVSDNCKLKDSDVLLVNGSGVDLAKYSNLASRTVKSKEFSFVIACRLLREKGVLETVKAVGNLYEQGISVKLVIAGSPDFGNPGSLTEKECENLATLPFVEYLGYCSDINSLYNRCNVAVMPSYYGEGIPKSLIEAAACGLPIITTDLPGCSDTVIDNVSGILVSPRSVNALEKAMLFMLDNPEAVANYGRASRFLAEEKFSVDVVVEQHLRVYESLARRSYD